MHITVQEKHFWVVQSTPPKVSGPALTVHLREVSVLEGDEVND